MPEIDKIYNKLVEKFGKTERASNLLSFYFLLKNYSLNEETVKDIYTGELFAEYLYDLAGAGITGLTENLPLQTAETFSSDKIEEINSLRLEKINLINLEWLRYFVVFSETGNSTEAANKLNITPQALSKALLGLESHYNVKLIERKKHFKGLTHAGKVFLEKSKAILFESYETEKLFKDSSKGEFEGELIIASTGIWSKYLLPDIISSFLRKYPRLVIKSQAAYHEVENQIIAGLVEVGFTTFKPEKSEIDFLKLEQTRYIIVGKPQEKKNWQVLNYIATLQDLSGIGWPEQEFRRKIIFKTNGVYLGIELARKGLGVIFVPELYIENDIKEGLLAIVAEPPVNKYLNLYIIWNKNLPLSAAAQRFIKEIRKLSKG